MFVEHVHCSRCGKRCSGVDPELGLVVRAWVECPECVEQSEGNSAKSEGNSSPPEDLALDTARDVLDGTVCECGHMASDHVGVNTHGFPNREPPNECQADDGGCACPQFSAVVFTVTRG